MSEVKSEARQPKPGSNGRSPSSSPRLRSDSRDLPPGWERVQSDQGAYYWHRETGETRWKYPESAAREHEKIIRKHVYVNVKPAKYGHPLTQAKASQRSPENRHKRHNGRASNGKKDKEPEADKDTTSQEQDHSYINLSQAHRLSGSFIQEGKERMEATRAGGKGRHSPNAGRPDIADRDLALPTSNRRHSKTDDQSYVNLPLGLHEPAEQNNTGSDRKQNYKDKANHTRSGTGEVPPPSTENRSGSATPTPVSGDDHVTSRERRSSTPPLPERRYDDEDTRSTPTPPLPDRHYDTPSPPPPIPERRYTNLEEDCDALLVLEKTRQKEMEAEMQRYRRKATSYEDVDLDDSGFKPHPQMPVFPDNSSKFDAKKEMREKAHEAGSHRLQREESPYEVLDEEDRLDLEPHQMSSSAEDQALEIAPEGEAGRSSQAQRPSRNPDHMVSQMGNEYTLINPAWKRDVRDRPPSLSGDNDYLEAPPLPKRNPGMKYVEVIHEAKPHTDSSFGIDPYRDSIAYAVVKLDEITHNPQIEGRVLAPPEPYEAPRASLPRNSIPSYETIDFIKEDSGSGYMKVDHHVQRKYVALHSEPQGTRHHVMERPHSISPPLPSQSSKDQERTRYHSPPLSQLEKSKSADEAETRDSTPPRKLSAGGPSPCYDFENPSSEAGRESFFESAKYDIPFNSRRMQALNVTLRRGSDLQEESPGYSRLGLSKEAILLRSGVTLRRSSRSSLSPLSHFAKRSSSSTEESGSGSNDGEEEEDSGLDAVNRCIQSMESSLRLKNSQEYEEYFEMEKAPVGPPKWQKFKRRAHDYEDVEREERPRSLSPARSMPELDLPDMDWDETDFGTPPSHRKAKLGSVVGSISQPNLHRPSQVDMDKVFPHLVQPERVSDEAFKLRKLRMLQHKYEDIDITEWPDVGVSIPGSVGSVGDVELLTSAIRESWMESDEAQGAGDKLPKGWKQMKDENGSVYYWHVPSGKTQYTKPRKRQTPTPAIPPKGEKKHFSTLTTDLQPEPKPERVRTQTFSARYLGGCPVSESELVPGQCVKVVHMCINRTTSARSKEGVLADKGRVVFLQTQGMELRWLNPETSSPIVVQPINKIRVWGIGLENERDFGYVARDLATKKHKCHVFRCDMPARAVARALLESHQREKRKSQLIKEDPMATSSSSGSLASTSTSGESGARSTSPESSDAVRESLLGPGMRGPPGNRGGAVAAASSNVVQASEKYTKVRCTYIGSCDVPKAAGMDELNEAVGKLSASQARWMDVIVKIATSHIKIIDVKTEKVVREHRVRFLCFLGIAKDERFCGYIIDSGERRGEKHFQFHGFRKEPNTDQLCLALHTACQERYQRVLDANPEAAKKVQEKEEKKESEEKSRVKSTSSLFGRIGSFKRTKKDEDSKGQCFVVQYLGTQQVSKSEGLEIVKEPVQQLSVSRTSPPSVPPHLVEFEVSPAGMAITDPQRRLFARKSFSVKNITYVVRIRNYFAFIAKESGKYHCYVFLESEVDAGTIVGTIQKMLVPDTVKHHRPKK